MAGLGDWECLFTAKTQRAQREAQSFWHDGVVVEWGGKLEGGILTRRRGDAEKDAEQRRSQRKNERGDSGGWWAFGSEGRGFRRENQKQGG